jgi:hypothetical protein
MGVDSEKSAARRAPEERKPSYLVQTNSANPLIRAWVPVKELAQA